MSKYVLGVSCLLTLISCGKNTNYPNEQELPNRQFGLNRLFAAGERAKIDGDDAKIDLQSLGRIHFSNGTIGVYDFGFDKFEFRPLLTKVAPGNYEVQLSKTDQTEIAVRLIFKSELQATKFVPAEFEHFADANTRTNVVLIDGARLSIFDAQAFLELSPEEKDQKWSEMLKKIEGEYLTDAQVEIKIAKLKANSEVGVSDDVLREFLKTAPHGSGNPAFSRLRSKEPTPPDWFDVSSANSDGGFPCYWGMNDDGEIVSLVVDFLCEIEFDDE